VRNCIPVIMGIPKRKQFSLLYFLPSNTLLSLKLSATLMFGVFAQIAFGRTVILRFIFHEPVCLVFDSFFLFWDLQSSCRFQLRSTSKISGANLTLLVRILEYFLAMFTLILSLIQRYLLAR